MARGKQMEDYMNKMFPEQTPSQAEFTDKGDATKVAEPTTDGLTDFAGNKIEGEYPTAAKPEDAVEPKPFSFINEGENEIQAGQRWLREFAKDSGVPIEQLQMNKPLMQKRFKEY